ncbi:MAG TPA: CDP-alcohol phosphatidyltransferase family protein [Patescibacteria group bacterium]|nr:CDP-alcohol phosphatidyltransferase family protein [Patescibacteria group bacterium]
MKFIDVIRETVRRVMRVVARGLNRLTGGKLSPHAVTLVGLAAHFPIAWLIASRHNLWAGILLIIFGLFDTLDGELARLQGRASPVGMFLDSVTDRMKEIIIYGGLLAAALNATADCGGLVRSCVNTYYGYMVVLLVALGGSLLTSYINAWGEAVLRGSSSKTTGLNKIFRGGLGSFEIRMFLLVVGLLFGVLGFTVPLIAVLAWATVLNRMNRVIKELKGV